MGNRHWQDGKGEIEWGETLGKAVLERGRCLYSQQQGVGVVMESRGRKWLIFLINTICGVYKRSMLAIWGERVKRQGQARGQRQIKSSEGEEAGGLLFALGSLSFPLIAYVWQLFLLSRLLN